MSRAHDGYPPEDIAAYKFAWAEKNSMNCISSDVAKRNFSRIDRSKLQLVHYPGLRDLRKLGVEREHHTQDESLKFQRHFLMLQDRVYSRDVDFQSVMPIK